APSASCSTVVRAGSALESLAIEKCRAASEATCGRCVMQTTWRPSASSRRRSPTARAVCPPMPASTSSKTSVAPDPALATPLRALELRAPRATALRMLEHRGDRAAVLALQAVEQGEPLLDRLELSRIGLDRLGRTASVLREIRRLLGERACADRKRVDLGVDT